MATEDESKPLAYIEETILKKRKRTENLALTRKAQLELGKYGQKKKKKQEVQDIKRPEEFVKAYRDKELDLIQLKQRGKRPKSVIGRPKSDLLFIIRIKGGKNDMHPKTRKILFNLRLRRTLTGVFVRATKGVLQMLQKVEPYVTYGYPNLKNVKELVCKKGYANIENQSVPLTDNNIIEQAMGKYGIICIEDIVHEIANVGPHFKEVVHFLGPFILNRPQGGFQGKKQPFKLGGEAGNRDNEINDLISKMN